MTGRGRRFSTTVHAVAEIERRDRPLGVESEGVGSKPNWPIPVPS